MSSNADEPPDHAYERVTNPERYQVLHETASQQIDQLLARHALERVDGIDLDRRASRAWPESPATMLVPLGGGAPITFTFTPFPGVMMMFGHDGHGSFPACGCDACDDDPVVEADRMTEVVADVVAGGFTETRHRHILRADVYESLLRSVVGGTVCLKGPVDSDLDPLMPPGITRWPPWTPAR